jgi:predicted transport protein
VDLFLKKLSDKLSPRRLYNYKIILVEGAKPPFGSLYRISRNKLLVLKKYLEENLSKKFIRSSKSSAAFLVIFIKKPSKELRLYIDYRNLNRITVKNRYSISLVHKILNRIIYTRFFIKFDIIAVFNKIRITEGNK